MSEKPGPARGWRLTLRPSEAEAWRAVPGDVRLRRAVKVLRRAFGLRVVEVEAEPSPHPGAIVEPEAP